MMIRPRHVLAGCHDTRRRACRVAMVPGKRRLAAGLLQRSRALVGRWTPDLLPRWLPA